VSFTNPAPGDPAGNPPPPYGNEAVGQAPGFGPPPAYGPPAEPPKKKSPLPGIIITVVVLIAGAVGFFFLNRDNAVNAKVGDCLPASALTETLSDASDLKTVDCAGADAKYSVVGVVENKTSAQFQADDNLCQAFPTAESVLWLGETGKAGKVFCLAPKGK
jgi:hypothetical protein